MTPVGLLIVIAAAGAGPVGRVTGVVVDAVTREPLAGASVVVCRTELGSAADRTGRFVIDGVPAGTWAIEASMVGYRSQVNTPVMVNPGHAAEVEFRLALERTELAEVRVRAEHFPRVNSAPVSERNFAAEEVRTAPGGNGDIQRVVQAMPAVVSSGDQDNEVIVRGGNPNENLFLVDGVEIPYPNHFGSFVTQGGPINMLNGLLVREVDFVAGAFPARYSGRTSSVMDVSLRRGSTEGLDGNVDMGVNGLGAVVEFPLPGRGNSLIASYHKSFLELMAASGVWGMSAVPYYDNLLAKTTVRMTPSHELSLLLLAGWDRIRISPGEDVVEHGYHIRQQTKRAAGGVGLRSLFGENGYGRLLLSGVSTGWNALVANDSLSQETVQVNLTSEASHTGRYDVSFRLLPGHETQAGVVASLVPADFRVRIAPETVYRYFYAPDSTVIDSTPLLDATGNPYVMGIDADAGASSLKTGGYLQHRLPIGKLGELTLGLRGDQFGYTGEWTVSPRAGFSSAAVLGGWRLHAGTGIHFQEPPWYVLLEEQGANRGLRSRRSDHYVIGADRVWGDDVRLSIEAYWKENSRLPMPAYWVTPDPYDYSHIYLDSGRGRSRGLELFLQKKHTRNWHGTVAYSYSQSLIGNPQKPESLMPADYDCRHVVTVVGSWDIEFHRQSWYQRLPGWFKATLGGFLFSDVATIGGRLRYMGGRPYTPREWQAETRRWRIDYDRYNSERYPAYMRFDLRWDHKFLWNGWALSWYLEIQNLLNRPNVWQYVWMDRDPRRQTVYQFGFWPMAGLVIEF